VAAMVTVGSPSSSFSLLPLLSYSASSEDSTSGSHPWLAEEGCGDAAGWPFAGCTFPFAVEHAAIKEPCDGALR
jgi:hypothetical protein